MKKVIVAFLLLFLCLCARAQFYTWGVDDGALKWYQIETAHYRIVYPAGCDSLAREYARTLEKFHDPVGIDLGYSATQMLKKKMPVILHTGSSYSNGMVVWAPKRMELVTTPDLGDPTSTPWMEQLVLHESRHVAQMQFTHDMGWKVGRVFLGDIMSGVASALITDPSLLEGDAVTAETALTSAGRGRSGVFLEYYHSAFDSDDIRNFWRWRYGSQKLYTPDYYRAGYLRIAGARVLAQDPMVVRDYIRKPFIAGKRLERMFAHVSDSLRQEWALADSLRGPFPEVDTLGVKFRLFTRNFSNAVLDGHDYSLLEGLDRNPELIRIGRDGQVERIASFSANTSELKTDSLRHRIVWSEVVGDARWSQKSYSIIRYLSPEGKICDLTRKTRYFSVACCPSSMEYAAICYPGDGSCYIATIDSGTGEETGRLYAPKGLEYMSLTYVGDDIYASGITADGTSIYNVSAGNVPVMQSTFAQIGELAAEGDCLTFVSDRTGVVEFYMLNPATGKIRQKSLSKLGGYDWKIAGDSLYFNAVGKDGYLLSRTSAVDIPVENMDYSFHSFLSETITRQEDSLGVLHSPVEDPEISAPAKYSKFGHLFRFHSWAPVYVDYDEIEDMSFSSIGSVAQVGAMAFFQNDLSTSSGYVGIGLDSQDYWRPYFHLNYKYSGLLPVFEIKADIGRIQSGTAKIYIPWSRSKGGIITGFIPTVKFGISSSSVTLPEDENLYTNASLAASIRTYAMTSVAPSAIYPRLGIGAEAGIYSLPFLSGQIRSDAYFLVYSYLPGIIRTHGLKLTAMTQFQVGSGKYCTPYANMAPRGLSSYDVLKVIGTYPLQAKFTVDYALPLFPVDWTWACPVAYIRNFELIPHFDWTYFTAGGNYNGTLSSVGADFDVRLENLAWIPYTTRIGLSYSYCGGSYFQELTSKVEGVKSNYFGLIFTIDF